MIEVKYRRRVSGKSKRGFRIEKPEQYKEFATYEHTVERWLA